METDHRIFCCDGTPIIANDETDSRAGRAELAAHLYRSLADAVRRLSETSVTIRHPGATSGFPSRGQGHFHLAAELFVQLSGWTRFQFPQGSLRLAPGEMLLVPPRVLHHESVGNDDGGVFENLVVYAEDGAFRCHLAREAMPGVPGMLYVDMGRHAQAPRIQDWLAAAAALASGELPGAVSLPSAAPEHDPEWAQLQSRALVTAALAGALRALDDQRSDAQPEPILVSRVRIMVQNQLGDVALSVGSLARQTGYSADYLTNCFSVATGEHLSAYINRLRLERAVHLLRESTLAGKEIAWACGYASPSYFIRAFRAHFGQTPKTWRQAKS